MSAKVPTFEDLKTRAERMRGTFRTDDKGWMLADVPNPIDEDAPCDSCSTHSGQAMAAFLVALEREWETT